jgi:hypothetical protein
MITVCPSTKNPRKAYTLYKFEIENNERRHLSVDYMNESGTVLDAIEDIEKKWERRFGQAKGGEDRTK